MKYQVAIRSFFAMMGICQASVFLERANGKANEYPNPHCMDPTTASVYIATSPRQHVTAFSNAACNPGENNKELLGSTGGACVELGTHFNQGAIHSLLFNIPVFCVIADLVEGMPEAAVEGLKMALELGLL
ncbi:hypothetical protein GLAREA_01259 [Glarea lozoyensis ATCC 20868]|uniref:Uncharacterized protein n=1 Tax=Glarea lozoyensis (strain ATCC 20868 / MF5171) TaxID=1116229 RepID=S3CFS7_GLAL2|nr:uncharacterized protein GLAREA_01259 [Glarea lozoyensis ATCC 20868]EPE25347.1 hypothetical protein GLAREA_01259 [Glarea lozoyensis ATCC 20868]